MLLDMTCIGEKQTAVLTVCEAFMNARPRLTRYKYETCCTAPKRRSYQLEVGSLETVVLSVVVYELILLLWRHLGKALISTGLIIAVPEGTYGRVAPRSGLGAFNVLSVRLSS